MTALQSLLEGIRGGTGSKRAQKYTREFRRVVAHIPATKKLWEEIRELTGGEIKVHPPQGYDWRTDETVMEVNIDEASKAFVEAFNLARSGNVEPLKKFCLL